MKKVPLPTRQLSYLPLTARTKGAVAVIDLVGDELPESLGQVFESVSWKRFREFRPQSLIYGHWQNRLGSREDLLLCPIADGHVEIQCHGGPAAVDAICDTLSHLGFSRRSAREPDGLHEDGQTLWNSELTMALQRCPTKRTAKWVLSQIQRAPGLLADMEAMTGQDIARVIDNGLAWRDFGRHLIEPWTIVLAGRPNVGKSSLINALAGFDRAIVHATPGTTRDVVQQATAIDGWPVMFSDTAGLRDSENPVEVEGIEAAKQVIQEADLLVHVVDGSQSGTFEVASEREFGREPDLIVINKLDLLSPTDLETVKEKLTSTTPTLLLSAKSRDGLERLTDWLSQRLVPHCPKKDALIPITERMTDWLKLRKAASSRTRQPE